MNKKTLTITSIVTSTLSILLAIISILLPVKNTQITINWPQSNTININAPAATQTAHNLEITIPVKTLLANQNTTGTLLTTIPNQSELNQKTALNISITPQFLNIVSRGINLLSTPTSSLLPFQNQNLIINTQNNQTTAQIPGSPIHTTSNTLNQNTSPQIAGLYTNLNLNQLQQSAIKATIQINNQFDIQNTITKKIAQVLAIILGIIALISVYLLKRKEPKPEEIQTHKTPKLHNTDIIVTLVLILWNFLGAGSVMDGYQITQTTASKQAGYIPEYYRFFNVTAAPYDWYLALLHQLTNLTINPFFLRIPSIIIGIALWYIIRRFALPIIGEALNQTIPQLISALTFLSMWIILNSGLQPEIFITFGALTGWVLIEKSLTKNNPLIWSFALLILGLTITTHPAGIIGLAVLLATMRSSIAMFRKQTNLKAMLAAPVSVIAILLVIIFRQQTIPNIFQAIRVKTIIGPLVSWTQEYLRYYFLAEGPDGSMTVHLAVIPFLLLLAITTLILLRQRGHEHNLWHYNTAWRFVSIPLITILLQTLNPVKWVSQFGIYTAFIAPVTALAITAIIKVSANNLRNSFLMLSLIALAYGYAISAKNSWPWMYQIGLPWYDIQPQVAGVYLSDVGLVVTALLAGVALIYHYIQTLNPKPKIDETKEESLTLLAQNSRTKIWQTRIITWPIAIITSLTLLLNIGMFLKAYVSNSNSFTITKNNLNLAESGCGIANQILVEKNPNKEILQPAQNQNQTQALVGNNPDNTGFTPNGIPVTINDPAEVIPQGHQYVASTPQNTYNEVGQYPGTDGKSTTPTTTINGSNAALPFGLDPKTTPVLGSYGSPTASHLTTGWYKLPDNWSKNTNQPILVISAAGSIASYNINNVYQFGQVLTTQFATEPNEKDITNTQNPIDADGGWAWRNLRFPLNQVNPTAKYVRIVVDDNSLLDNQWVALTPPRVPNLETLSKLIPDNIPVLKDLATAAQFPCIEQAGLRDGLSQIPQYRITPNRLEMDATSHTWQKPSDGGILAITEALTKASTIPSYLDNNWYEDWGSIQKLTQLPDTATAQPAQLTKKTVTHWGWWNPGNIQAVGGNDDD